MKSRILSSAAAALALTLAGSLPAAAQKVTSPGTGSMQVIALQSRVEGIDSRGRKTGRADEMYSIKNPDEPIPIAAGERLRVHLVGTGLVNGNGTEVPVNANFNLAAGKESLTVVQTGPNWVIVEARGSGDKLSQVAYSVNGNYDIKPGLASGRLTFDDVGGGGASQPIETPNRDQARWDRARSLTDQLYQGILDQRLGGRYEDQDIEHVYSLGYRGLRDVALTLARQRSQGRQVSQADAQIWVADLYRTLLKRTQSDREMWDQDEGFRGNVESLQRNGLERVVQTIVDSDEYVVNNNLRSFSPIATSSDNWRGGARY